MHAGCKTFWGILHGAPQVNTARAPDSRPQCKVQCEVLTCSRRSSRFGIGHGCHTLIHLAENVELGAGVRERRWIGKDVQLSMRMVDERYLPSLPPSR